MKTFLMPLSQLTPIIHKQVSKNYSFAFVESNSKVWQLLWHVYFKSHLSSINFKLKTLCYKIIFMHLIVKFFSKSSLTTSILISIKIIHMMINFKFAVFVLARTSKGGCCLFYCTNRKGSWFDHCCSHSIEPHSWPLLGERTIGEFQCYNLH